MSIARVIHAHIVALALVVSVLPNASMALNDDCVEVVCEMAAQPWWSVDKRVRVSSDCSFENAGDGWYDGLAGQAAMDIGGGRISQGLVDSACAVRESVLFADCNSLETVEVFGGCLSASEFDRFGVTHSADLIFSPEGALVVTSESTIREISADAEQHGYSTYSDFVDRQQLWKKKNRVDPFCGCKLFYPDTAGAKK